jgi:NCS1 family nucleobase:cation symporter-1
MDLLRTINARITLNAEHVHAHGSHWINDDIKPLPPSRRTWGVWSFVSFWAINNLVIYSWTTGSTLIGLGLSVWQAMIAVIIARIIIILVAVFNGYVGAEWHIGFAVLSRYVWGFWGSFVPLVQRIILSMVWMGVQAWTGGLCISAMLSAIFPSYQNMKNTMPVSAHMETKQFVGFIIFNLMTCAVIWKPVEKTRWLFVGFNIVTFLTMIGLLGWSVDTAGGTGRLLSAPGKAKGSYETGWAVVKAISSVIGSIAVGLTNQPDYSRYAQKPGDQVHGQIFSIFFFGTIIPLLGCVTASATQQIYGETIWNPPDILARILDDSYTSKARAGCFFAAAGLAISQLAINCIDNAFSGGFDLAGLFPRYINIRRGAYLTLAIAILFQPWQLLSSASVFLSVLGAYSTFLGPMTGIMITDYWFIRQRKVKLSDLYKPNPSSIYWFTNGFNFRSFVAWFLGFIFLLPGFVHNVNTNIAVPEAFKNLYYLSFPLGFVISATIFYGLNTFFPPEGLGEIDEFDMFGTFTEDEARRLGMAPSTIISVDSTGKKMYEANEKSV